MTITWCIVPEIWSVTKHKKIKFWKTEKITWRYYHFTIVRQKSWSYAILFLRYGVWQMWLFFILGHFFSFTPLTAQKSKLKKIKTPGDIMSLHKCIKNQDHILCCSWDMARDRCNCYFFSFWAICCPFNSPPLSLTTRKIKMKKSTWRYYHFTHVYHKWQSHDVWFLK